MPRLKEFLFLCCIAVFLALFIKLRFFCKFFWLPSVVNAFLSLFVGAFGSFFCNGVGSA